MSVHPQNRTAHAEPGTNSRESTCSAPNTICDGRSPSAARGQRLSVRYAANACCVLSAAFGRSLRRATVGEKCIGSGSCLASQLPVVQAKQAILSQKKQVSTICGTQLLVSVEPLISDADLSQNRMPRQEEEQSLSLFLSMGVGHSSGWRTRRTTTDLERICQRLR
jgi:hypothetical protein